MGHGDFKLLAALGAWLGWELLPAVILLSSLVGAVVGISLMVFRKHGRESANSVRALFGGGGVCSAFGLGQKFRQPWFTYLGV